MSGRDKDATRAANGAHDGDLPYLVGEDGYPLGGPSDAEFAHAAETRFRRDMQAALDRWQGGDRTAFTEAMRLCWRRDPDGVPYRLVEASEVLVECALAEVEKRTRDEWAKHLARWEPMIELLERGHELARLGKANLEDAKALISSKATDAQKRARLVDRLPELIEASSDDRGTSVERASVAVSEALKTTDAKGEARTVKASYELIERLGGKHATFERYRELLRRRTGKQD
jgi:hypothetical protein